MNNKVCAISGITGQLGSYLAGFLLEKNYRVIGLKRRTSTNNSTYRIDHLLNNKNLELKYFDLNDSTSNINLFNNNKIDEFYHCAASSHVRISSDLPEQTINDNILGTLKIISSIKELSPNTKLINLASSEMFGNNPNIPFSEDSKFMPISPYAISKVAAFHLIEHYRKAYNLFLSNAICFNYEGPHRGENFVTRKITQAVANIKCGKQDKLILGNIASYRDWSYIADIADGLYKIIQYKEPDNFVLCSGKAHSVQEFIEETFKIAGFNDNEWKSYVEFDPIYCRPQEVDYLLGDSSKANIVLNWKPKVTFKELVSIMYNADLLRVKNGR